MSGSVTRVEGAGVEAPSVGRPEASTSGGWAFARRTADAALDLTDATARGAAGAAKSAARKVRDLILHACQWLVWTSLTVAAAGLIIIVTAALGAGGLSAPHFWAGAGLLALLVVTHFPPLFFQLPRGWKRAPYILLVPATLGVLTAFGLGMDLPEGSPASPQSRPQHEGVPEGAKTSPPSPGRGPPETISVPSDPRATYFLVSRSRLPNGNLEVVTRRVGPSGAGYSRREIDCGGMSFRYTAEGDTLADLERPYDVTAMGPLTPESISTYVARHACP